MPVPAAPSDSHMTSALWSGFMVLLGENSSMDIPPCPYSFSVGSKQDKFWCNMQGRQLAKDNGPLSSSEEDLKRITERSIIRTATKVVAQTGMQSHGNKAALMEKSTTKA